MRHRTAILAATILIPLVAGCGDGYQEALELYNMERQELERIDGSIRGAEEDFEKFTKENEGLRQQARAAGLDKTAREVSDSYVEMVGPHAELMADLEEKWNQQLERVKTAKEALREAEERRKK